MGTNNINFRYLFEGTFTHLNGLPLNDGTVVNAYWCDDRIVFVLMKTDTTYRLAIY